MQQHGNIRYGVRASRCDDCHERRRCQGSMEGKRMATLIGERDRRYLESVFEKMEGKTRLLIFTENPSKLVVPGERPCTYCQQTVQLVQEMASTTDKVELAVDDGKLHLDTLREYRIDLL